MTRTTETGLDGPDWFRPTCVSCGGADAGTAAATATGDEGDCGSCF